MSGFLRRATVVCLAMAWLAFCLAAAVGLPDVTPGEEVNAEAVRATVAGKMVGIGVGLELADGGVRIKNIVPNSPAERASLKAGCVITAVADRPTAGLTLEDVVKLICGPEGSKVSLSLRLPDGSTQTVELERAAFAMDPVQSRRLANGIVLLRIPRFSQTTPNDCRRIFQDFLNRETQGLIVDLRGCMGGTIPATKAVAELLLPAGSPLWGLRTDGRRATNLIAGGSALKLPRRIPMVVLIDKNTSSAGVLLTYALKENGRATLLGQETTALNRPRNLVTGPGGKGRLVEFGDFLSARDEPLTGQRMKPDVMIPTDTSDEEWLQQAIRLLNNQSGTSESAGGNPKKSSAHRLRTWTDVTGKFRTEAEFLGLENGKVRLRKSDGVVITVPLDRLNANDRKWATNKGL